MHIHLDLIGGIAGDMFVGTLLDCFPELAESLPGQMRLAGFENLVSLKVEPVNDGTLTGTRFKVTAAQDAHGHHHRHYSEIRQIIDSSALDETTKSHALGIFRIIAEAEASIHGKTIDSVAFHEIGAWDSIADIVCAAALITATGAHSWSTSALPLGRGQVKTAHGMLPVPAPATALILKGFDFFDDGREGERITPTGAAILKYLCDANTQHRNKRLEKTGFGFGTKQFPGISNVVRALVFNDVESKQSPPWDYDEVLQLEFEIDDETPEEISISVDRIRATPGVIDVTQQVLIGKKGRTMVSLRVLGKLDAEAAMTRACFDETTTLGLRRQVVSRAILRRREALLETDGGAFRVKIAERPGGITAKLEADDTAALNGNHATRSRIKAGVEIKATEADKHD